CAEDFDQWYTRLTAPHGLSSHTARSLLVTIAFYMLPALLLKYWPRLVYPTASRRDPTDISASRLYALGPAAPTFLYDLGIERGKAVGTTSPHLSASADLAAHATPRDLGPDAHARSEMFVAAGELGE
ncbi:hypothetical protein EV121DRAFT_274545, partial [Schizophyllum commune]